MEPKGYMPYYEDPKIMAEIDIRGRFMMMAADIEWSMLNIILFCAPDPNNSPRGQQFEGMMMNQKIECTICDLKKYKPNYYHEYKEYLDMLLEFKEVRNDMGHYRIDFCDDKLQEFTMPYIGTENGQLAVLHKSYKVFALKDIINRFRKANFKFLELIQKLEFDYNSIEKNTI